MATRKSVRAPAVARKPSRARVSAQVAVIRPGAAPTIPSKAATTETLAASMAKKPKQKLVRDSFTIPKNEYLVLADLKQRALDAGRSAKKSEVLRAGIRVLSLMPDAALLLALSAIPSLKTGRPKEAKKTLRKGVSTKK